MYSNPTLSCKQLPALSPEALQTCLASLESSLKNLDKAKSSRSALHPRDMSARDDSIQSSMPKAHPPPLLHSAVPRQHCLLFELHASASGSDKLSSRSSGPTRSREARKPKVVQARLDVTLQVVGRLLSGANSCRSVHQKPRSTWFYLIRASIQHTYLHLQQPSSGTGHVQARASLVSQGKQDRQGHHYLPGQSSGQESLRESSRRVGGVAAVLRLPC